MPQSAPLQSMTTLERQIRNAVVDRVRQAIADIEPGKHEDLGIAMAEAALNVIEDGKDATLRAYMALIGWR